MQWFPNCFSPGPLFVDVSLFCMLSHLVDIHHLLDIYLRGLSQIVQALLQLQTHTSTEPDHTPRKKCAPSTLGSTALLYHLHAFIMSSCPPLYYSLLALVFQAEVLTSDALKKTPDQGSEDGSSDTDGKLCGFNNDSSLYSARLELTTFPAFSSRPQLIFVFSYFNTQLKDKCIWSTAHHVIIVHCHNIMKFMMWHTHLTNRGN